MDRQGCSTNFWDLCKFCLCGPSSHLLNTFKNNCRLYEDPLA
uniref:Uncharacterized protein n=1 Tax=Anguilla anguilla TaxID=7936 RepID=A0A0E9U0U3_ANGAN